MPALEAYKRELDYSYAPGLFPSLEAMTKRPQLVRRLLVSSKGQDSEGMKKLTALAEEKHIRIETADKALSRISGKENCFAAAVFEKRPLPLDAQGDHVVLHHISDQGNLGTILRTALGFGYHDIAIIRPAADVYDPKVVRASMGALFSLRVTDYGNFSDYWQEFGPRAAYPFMLDGSVPDLRQRGRGPAPRISASGPACAHPQQRRGGLFEFSDCGGYRDVRIQATNVNRVQSAEYRVQMKLFIRLFVFHFDAT